MKKTVIAMAVAGLALAGCAAPAQTPEPAPTVTVTAAPEPEPIETVDDAMGKDFFLDLFDIAWLDMSTQEQQDLCDSYILLGADVSYEYFSEGLGTAFDQSWLEEAMFTHC